MTCCKYTHFLMFEGGLEYDTIYKAGTSAPFPGIYYCEACGSSVTAMDSQPLPSNDQHLHAPAQGPARWRLAIKSHQGRQPINDPTERRMTGYEVERHLERERLDAGAEDLVNSLAHQIAELPADKLVVQLRATLNPPLEPGLRQRLVRALEDASTRFKELADALERDASQGEPRWHAGPSPLIG